MKQNRNYEYTISGGIYKDLPRNAVDLLAKMLIKDMIKESNVNIHTFLD